MMTFMMKCIILLMAEDHHDDKYNCKYQDCHHDGTLRLISLEMKRELFL